MNKFLFLFGLILFSSFALATDMSINSIDFNQPYVNQQVSFKINFNPDGQSGIIRFVDNGYLVTQSAFDSSMTQLTFNYTWNVQEARNIRFYFADINTINDTNLSNNEWTKTIQIKKGLDLEIDTISTLSAILTPGQITIFNFKIKNSGDENFDGNIPVDLVIDSNTICSGLTDLNTLNGTCSWLVPADTNKNSFTITAIVNRFGIIKEFSTLNNSKNLDATTVSKPDLVIDKILVNTQIKRGSISNIGVVVKNNGLAAALGDPIVDFYLAHLGTEYKIYSATIGDVFSLSTKALNYAYVFSDIGDYNIRVVVNAGKTINESIFTNNELSYKITVLDFNLDTVLAENDDYRKQIIEKDALIQAKAIENEQLRKSVIEYETRNGSLATNLEVCNTTNFTTMSNWKKDYDANQNAMIETLRNENNKCLSDNQAIINEKDMQIRGINDEMNQWEFLFVIILVVGISIILYFKVYLPNKPHKGVGMR